MIIHLFFHEYKDHSMNSPIKLLACLLLLSLTQIVISKLLGELLSDFGIAEVSELFIDPGNALINPATIAIIPGREDQRNEGEAPQEKEPVPEHLHFRVRQQVQALHAIRGHHIKRGKTYAKAVKLVYDGGFCCKKREKRLTGIPIKASEPFHPFK